MALDKGLVQNINLRANGDQLLPPLRAFGREINKAITDLNKLMGNFSKGAHEQDNQLRRQVQTLQRLIGEANTLQSVLTGAGSRRRNSLLADLDEQTMGKRAMSASRVKRELDTTRGSADALEVRLAQLYKRFNGLAEAGRKVGQRDLNKALGTEEAIKQVRSLERAINQLDAKQRVTGRPLSNDQTALRGQISTAQEQLLNRIKNPNRSNWTTEIAQLDVLVGRYRSLSKAQTDAALASDRAAQSRVRDIMQQVNLTESMLRSQINRAAGKFSFTSDQARGFDIKGLNQQIDSGIQRLGLYQRAMANAVNGGKSQDVIDRLGRSFQGLKDRIAEATAQRKAFDSLPENKMAALNKMLFGEGNWKQFGARIAGASVISTGVFAAMGAIQNGVQNVLEFEDAMGKLQAIAGATDIEMLKLSGSILAVARNSRYSTLELTEAATQIAQAGFSATETAKVLQDAMTLATASGSSPAEAVDTVTSALGAFQLQASESGRVVDTLVNGLNRSKLAMNQMQAAIQYAGATAFENNVSFEELVAVAGSLANAGIRSGSTIGTGLRQLMVDLKTPTEDFKAELQSLGLTMADVDVKSLGLAEVVRNLTDAGFSAEAAYKSFEVRAASSFLAFRNQIDAYDDLKLALAQTGAAQQAADRASESTTAKWQKMLNTVTELVASLSGPLMDTIGLLIDGLAKVAAFITDVNEAMGGLLGELLVVAAGFAVGGPWGAAVAAVAMFAAQIRGASDATEELVAKTNEAKQEFDSQKQTVASVDDAIKSLITREETLKGHHTALQAETVTLASRFEGLSTHLQGAAISYDNLKSAMLRYRGEALRGAAEAARSVQIAAGEEKRGFGADFRSAQSGAQSYLRNRSGSDYSNRVVGNAVDFLKRSRSLEGMNGDQLISTSIDYQSQINNLRGSGLKGNVLERLIEELQKQKDLLDRYKAAQSQYDAASRDIQSYNIRQSAGGQQRDQWVNDAQSGVDRGMRLNKGEAGTGDVTIDQTLSTARARIGILEKKLATVDPTKNPVSASALASDIQRLEEQVARVTSARDGDARDALKHPEKDRAGDRLTSDQVATQIKRLVPRARITDTTRTVAQQRSYNTRKGDPSKAPHVQGRALDMGIIPGMDPMEIVGMLEDMGLNVTAAPVHADGIRFVTPNHGTAPHWHFEWGAKQTAFERRQTTAKEKAARELQQLLEAQADAGVGTQRAKISRLTNEAKAGMTPVGSLSLDFNQALLDYKEASLNKFDVEHSTTGLGPDALKARDLARAELAKRIEEETGSFYATFYRQIADTAQNLYDVAIAAAERKFEEEKYRNEAPVRDAQSAINKLGNRTNRSRFGEGTHYRFGRDLEDAQLTSDKANAASLSTELTTRKVEIDKLSQALQGAVVGSDEYHKRLEALAKAQEALNEKEREHAALLQTIDEREARIGERPIGTVIRDSAEAWLENSGAMDSWAKRAENGVGPLLDNLTSGFTDFFTSFADGSKSFGGALLDMVGNFSKFVLQMIAQALALEAVKGILGLFGLSLPGAYNGGPVKRNAYAGTPAYNGGPVVVQGRFGGGVSHLPGGGAVRRGFTTHDSALYNLAAGEFVTRGKSVSEIGVNNMETINKFGKAGLDKVAGKNVFTNLQMPKQETNVFVVQERQKPPMGPNDVLVTIHNDILQNGPTKKLIRQVSQGG